MARRTKDDSHFDLVVIGSGSAGDAAARAARGNGHSVAVVEKDKLGGDCANYACVPSKALLRSARVYAQLKKAREFGLRAKDVGFDWPRMVARKDRIVGNTSARSAEERYAREGIALIRGTATFADVRRLRVDGRVIAGERLMLATGSKPARPRIPGADQVSTITSVDAASLPQLPKRIAIVGGGPVGCEFAQLFSTLGVEVVLIQRAPRLLEREEPELSALVQQSLVMNGATILTSARVDRFENVRGLTKVYASVDGEPYDFFADQVLLATGRQAQVDELALDAAGVSLDEHGFVQVNEFLQTAQLHIYAAGDVAGPLRYTHLATYQGQLAGWNMFAAEPQRADYRVVPHVTFTDPEIASVGLSEAKAHAAGHSAVSVTFDVKTLGRALVDSTNVGLIKLVGDARTGEILGGHIVAPGAGELIHEIVAAMQARAHMQDLARAIHAYPTFSEGIQAAAGEWVDKVEQEARL